MTQPPYESLPRGATRPLNEQPSDPADEVAFLLADARARAQALIDESVEQAARLLRRHQPPPAESEAIDALRHTVADLAAQVHALHARLDGIEASLRARQERFDDLAPAPFVRQAIAPTPWPSAPRPASEPAYTAAPPAPPAAYAAAPPPARPYAPPAQPVYAPSEEPRYSDPAPARAYAEPAPRPRTAPAWLAPQREAPPVYADTPQPYADVSPPSPPPASWAEAADEPPAYAAPAPPSSPPPSPPPPAREPERERVGPVPSQAPQQPPAWQQPSPAPWAADYAPSSPAAQAPPASRAAAPAPPAPPREPETEMQTPASPAGAVAEAARTPADLESTEQAASESPPESPFASGLPAMESRSQPAADDSTEGTAGAANARTAVLEPSPAAIDGIAPGSVSFGPSEGSVLIRVSPVAGFQGLMRVQDGLARLRGVREAGVEAYSQGEARLRLQLDDTVESEQLAAAVGDSIGRPARISSASASDRSVQMTLE